MPDDAAVKQIKVMFGYTQRRTAATSIPQPGSLSQTLTSLVDRAAGNLVAVDTRTLALFASASVEMWHRSVHSFLVSAALTNASPLWASVSGYYSSHYSVRAFAHLLGYFQLFNRKKILQIMLNGGRYCCYIDDKHARDREHKFYWNAVKRHSPFADDPLFAFYQEVQPRSDAGHRSKANYADHVNKFPNFRVLDEELLKQRVEKIAGIEISDAPIPIVESYPDLENVQLISYHRMVKFRQYLDKILGDDNRFWNVHRKPSWCLDYLHFQVVEPRYTSVYTDRSA